MVSHATMVMLQDSVDDTEGKYTRSSLQRIQLQRARGHYEQIIYYIYQCSLFDYNVKKFQLPRAPGYYDLSFVHQTDRCKWNPV